MNSVPDVGRCGCCVVACMARPTLKLASLKSRDDCRQMLNCFALNRLIRRSLVALFFFSQAFKIVICEPQKQTDFIEYQLIGMHEVGNFKQNLESLVNGMLGNKHVQNNFASITC